MSMYHHITSLQVESELRKKLATCECEHTLCSFTGRILVKRSTTCLEDGMYEVLTSPGCMCFPDEVTVNTNMFCSFMMHWINQGNCSLVVRLTVNYCRWKFMNSQVIEQNNKLCNFTNKSVMTRYSASAELRVTTLCFLVL